MKVEGFGRLMLLHGSQAGGDALVSVALAGSLFFSSPLDEARSNVGLYLLLTMAPFAVLAPLLGPLIDRSSRALKIALVGAGAGRALAAWFMATRTDELLLYPLAFTTLVLSRLHGVGRAAYVPTLLPPSKTLVWANSRSTVVAIIGATVLAPVGAGLHAWLGPGVTLRLAAAVFAASAYLAIGLPWTRRQRERRSKASIYAALTSRVVSGGLAIAGTRAAIGFLTFGLAFALRQQGETGAGLGVVAVAAGIGWFAGAVIAPLLRAVLREFPTMMLCLALMAATAFALAPSLELWRAALAAGITAACASAARLAFDSLAQTELPEEVRGRVFSRYETLFQLAWVLGAGVSTVFGFSSATSLRSVGAICLGGLALAIRGLLTDARRSSVRSAR